MKHCLVTLAALTVAASSYAQGTLNFVNKITGTLDARVTYNGSPAVGGGTTDETKFVAQLYASAPGGTLAPVGDPIPFRNSGAGTGYWVGATRTIIGVAEAGTAQAQVRVWSTGLGATYEAAAANANFDGGYASSAVLTGLATGGGIITPGVLTGLAAFDVPKIVPVPEPGVAALGLLGAGLLLIRRKK